MSRKSFRQTCVERDGGECIVPWCQSSVTIEPDGAGEVHHIIERELWPNGGYLPRNGVCVCNHHHRMAERDEIPPQAFWRWAGTERPVVPRPGERGQNKTHVHVDEKVTLLDIDKWGDSFGTPPHAGLRDFHKYPSTRHLLPLYWQSERGTADERTGRDDTGMTSVETLLDIPLVVTVKMDGSNAMLVKDTDEPVRARNGKDAEHVSFDHLKSEYWDRNVYENLPEHLQVFGENMYAKHSIHYGCPHDGCGGGCDAAPPVNDIFLVFGVFDTRYNLWLSWPETQQVADEIGFPTTPVIYGPVFDIPSFKGGGQVEQQFLDYMTQQGEEAVDEGHEGIIVRSMYPFHYGQFPRKLGKFVRPNHVTTDEHWMFQETVRNVVQR